MTKIGLLRKLFCLGILSLFYGCAPQTIKFPVTAPAAYQGKAPASLKVQDFNSNKRNLGSLFSNEIAAAVTQEGIIEIVDKDTNAEAILKGRLIVGDLNVNSWSESFECIEYQAGKKKPVEKTCTNYLHSKKLDIKAQFDVIDRKNKMVLVSGTELSRFDEKFSGDSAESALTSAKTDDQIFNDTVIELAKLVLQKISPHKITVERELQGGNEDLELGIKYAVNGKSDRAMEFWEKHKESNDLKIKAAASYNLGVIKESKSEGKDEKLMDQAYEHYEIADRVVPGKDLYIKSLSRIDELRKQKQKLDTQR
ncbi:DUF6340 family protein [Nitrosomonas sp.]|uniref:DUF6340 family protein n=1 Tax=Nitrosomonas sp. TaxID=42353 RepID=UPI002718F165|nr:DUF6340 family protein [Nitrosomonas sp.]MDO8893436.1 DUF6340 family protein [Nitrosomonas sp.]